MIWLKLKHCTILRKYTKFSCTFSCGLKMFYMGFFETTWMIFHICILKLDKYATSSYKKNYDKLVFIWRHSEKSPFILCSSKTSYQVRYRMFYFCASLPLTVYWNALIANVSGNLMGNSPPWYAYSIDYVIIFWAY